MEQFRQQVEQRLRTAGEYEPRQLNQLLLLQVGNDIFQIRRPSAAKPPWEEAGYVGQIRTMWDHYRSMRQIIADGTSRRSFLRSVIEGWRHRISFQKIHRRVQQQARSVRRTRLAILTRQAEAQNQAGCNQALFDLLRKIAPKQARRRAQLRTKEGALMTPGAEAVALCDFWKAVNGRENESNIPVMTGYNFARDEIAEAIRGLQANKSAPQHCAPHVFWKLAAEPIADYVEDQMFRQWRQDRAEVPGDWAAAWLVFLHKPGKTSTDPSCLRPVSLLDPMGKAVCGVLKMHLVPYLMDKAKYLPLFGYIQQRSPQQALELVFAPCAEARDLAKAQTRSLYELRSGKVRSQCAGGLQISVDFSQAFDRADRGLLFKALTFLEVPTDLQELIKRWVRATTFHIHKADTQCSYSSDKGIRQGCKLSPTLWCCLFVYILNRIDQTLGMPWSQQHLVGFADDLHLRWLFSDRSGINLALQEAGTVLSLLEDMGFLLSRDKTVCLLRAEGVQVPHMLRKLIHKKNKQEERILCIDGRWQLPLRKQHVYLGAKISYGAFELQNAQHRKQAGQAAFARLRPTLMSQRALSLTKRLRLWQVFVVPATLYSLGASGLTRQADSSDHKAKMHSAERMSAAPAIFDRQVHGTDGMPKFSGCGHAFERWADLQKHIEENHCQGRIPVESEQVKSVLTRTKDGELDLAQIQSGDMPEALQRELLQHCSYCRQWFPMTGMSGSTGRGYIGPNPSYTSRPQSSGGEVSSAP